MGPLRCCKWGAGALGNRPPLCVCYEVLSTRKYKYKSFSTQRSDERPRRYN